MQIVQRVTRQQLSLRALLLIAGAALMIIVGLLGMHTFSADPAGHGTVSVHHSVAASSTATIDHPTPTAAASETTSAPCDDTCLTGSGQNHSDMVTACILALIAGIPLLLRPTLMDRLGPPLQLLPSSSRLQAVSVLPRTPSLIFLSISRT